MVKGERSKQRIREAKRQNTRKLEGGLQSQAGRDREHRWGLHTQVNSWNTSGNQKKGETNQHVTTWNTDLKNKCKNQYRS